MNIERIRNKLSEHLRLREGWRNKVYRDSLGKLTVGVGHLVLKSDGLKFGDYLTDEQVLKLLHKDSEKALAAALEQAKDLGRENEDFVVALASVNFQLGVGWTKIFYTSWPTLKAGNYQKAIQGFKRSAWAKQTPVRVNDFVAAILAEYESPVTKQPLPKPARKPVIFTDPPPPLQELPWWRKWWRKFINFLERE